MEPILRHRLRIAVVTSTVKHRRYEMKSRSRKKQKSDSPSRSDLVTRPRFCLFLPYNRRVGSSQVVLLQCSYRRHSLYYTTLQLHRFSFFPCHPSCSRYLFIYLYRSLKKSKDFSIPQRFCQSCPSRAENGAPLVFGTSIASNHAFSLSPQYMINE